MGNIMLAIFKSDLYEVLQNGTTCAEPRPVGFHVRMRRSVRDADDFAEAT